MQTKAFSHIYRNACKRKSFEKGLKQGKPGTERYVTGFGIVKII
jgi:hypothetical protein